jgi:hypothetical protein
MIPPIEPLSTRLTDEAFERIASNAWDFGHYAEIGALIAEARRGREEDVSQIKQPEMIDGGPFLMECEERYLRNIPTDGRRCHACGHLQVFHNDHCCQFCLIPECPCEWGRMPQSEIAKEIMR